MSGCSAYEAMDGDLWNPPQPEVQRKLGNPPQPEVQRKPRRSVRQREERITVLVAYRCVIEDLFDRETRIGRHPKTHNAPGERRHITRDLQADLARWYQSEGLFGEHVEIGSGFPECGFVTVRCTERVLRRLRRKRQDLLLVRDRAIWSSPIVVWRRMA